MNPNTRERPQDQLGDGKYRPNRQRYVIEVYGIEPGMVAPFITWLRRVTGGLDVSGHWLADLHLPGCELTEDQADMLQRHLQDSWVGCRITRDVAD